MFKYRMETVYNHGPYLDRAFKYTPEPGGVFYPRPNSLVFSPRSIKFGMSSLLGIIF